MIKVPQHLSAKAKEIFKTHTQGEYCNKSSGRIAAIIMVLEGLDRLTEIREELTRQGLWVQSKRSGLRRQNPLVKTEESQRRYLLRAWRKFGLGRDPNPFYMNL